MHQCNRERTYTAIAALFCVCLILTNTIGMKLFILPGIQAPLPAGLLIYPLTFVLNDVVNEIYGSQRASFMVWLSFTLNLLVMCIIRLVLVLPAHPHWFVPNNPWGFATLQEYQNAFNSVFQINTTIVFASMAAYLTGQLLDIFLYQKIKKLSNNRFLWLRSNVSTILSQLMDTIIVFSIILFYGLKVDFLKGVEIMIVSYSFKVIATLLTTPLFYGSIWFLRRGSSSDLRKTTEATKSLMRGR